MPHHTIPTCPNASTCSGPSEARRAKLAMPVKWCLIARACACGRIALQAGHASPVKWCLKEKVFLGKWAAIAMLELQRIPFAGWTLTEGQHRSKASGKKKDPRSGSFFSGSHFASDVPSRRGLTDFSPHSNIYLSIYLSPIHYKQ